MYYFIVNPNSRSGRGRSIWNEIHQQLMLRGIDFQYCLTRYSGHAAEIASDACALGTESEPVYIIAVGGDGTIHEVLTASPILTGQSSDTFQPALAMISAEA